MPDAIGRRAEQHVLDEAVAVRGHRDQIDALILRHLDQLRRRIAHREPGLHRQAARRQLAAQLLEVVAIRSHLLALAQLQLIEVARGPAVGDVHEQELGAGDLRELGDVVDDGAIGARVLHGDQDATVHQIFQPRSA